VEIQASRAVTPTRHSCFVEPHLSLRLLPSPHVRAIESWLAAAPHLTAVDVLNRLHESAPDAFGDQQRRTLQRFVRAWRARTAKLLIDCAEAIITIDAPFPVPAGTGKGAKIPDPDAQLGNISP
jgi:hypothetical protein